MMIKILVHLTKDQLSLSRSKLSYMKINWRLIIMTQMRSIIKVILKVRRAMKSGRESLMVEYVIWKMK